MNPADQPPIHEVPRSTDPPSLWLSLVLGSVLIHLVLFILASLFLTRTARVEIDPEPISVEFVEPTTVAARSTTTKQSIAARPGAPSAKQPSATQAQPNTGRSQPSAVNPSVEQPFVPQPMQRRRLPIRPRQPQPQSLKQPVPPTPTSTGRPIQPQPRPSQPSFPQRQNLPFPQPSATQPFPSQSPIGSSQASLAGSQPDPSESSATQPSESQAVVEGQKITQRPLGESAIVNVLGTTPPPKDIPTQLAQTTVSQQSVLIHYPAFLAKQTIQLQATLIIDQTGRVLDTQDETLLFSSSSSEIDQGTLHEVADQIFTQWQFSPAKDTSDDGKLLTPPQSKLIIKVQVQMP